MMMTPQLQKAIATIQALSNQEQRLAHRNN